MRYRLMASYRGSPFEAGVGPTDADIVLFAACPPPEELGFEPATGHWRKQLRIQDVEAVWESRPVGMFRGARCIVLDDLGDRLHIGFLGHDGYQAEQLGYWQVDRGVFELVAPRIEVADIVEERVEYPQHRTPAGDDPAAPQTSAQPPGTAQDQARYLPPTLPHDQASYLPAALAPDHATGQAAEPGYLGAGFDQLGMPSAQDRGPAGYQPVLDESSGVALPPQAEPPLPLEAEALRAATASRRPRQHTGQRRSAGQPTAAAQDAPLSSAAEPQPGTGPRSATSTQPDSRPTTGTSRRSARQRLATERLFAELATLAAIPADSYAVGAEVEGALCLLQTDEGFEVFHCAAGNRHELQSFHTEEAAYFYLFGVLAAEAVRSGSLQPAAEQLMSGTGPLPTGRSAR